MRLPRFKKISSFRSNLSNHVTKSTARTILIAAIITEGLVIIVAALLWGLFDLAIFITPSWHGALLGVVATLPLLVLNEVTHRYALRVPESTAGQFSREVVVPLCANVSPALAAILGLLSGTCEELLFRGALPPLFSPFLGNVGAGFASSALFAWVHFIGQERRFAPIILLYLGVGLYFWGLTLLTGDLFSAMVCHGLHNFFVINITRMTDKSTTL